MRGFQVPQFIDIEDKVIGPLTIKQFLWLLVGGGLAFFIWSSFPLLIFIVIGVPIVLLFLGLAFYKPQGRPFSALLLSAIGFTISPKTYVWHKKKQGHSKIFQEEKIIQKEQVKRLGKNKLNDLAWKLDQ